MRRIEFGGHAAHGDQGHVASGEPVERVEEVLHQPPPPAQFGDQSDIDHACLHKFEDPGVREPIAPGPQGRFPADAENLEPAALGESREFADLGSQYWSAVEVRVRMRTAAYCLK